MGQSLGQRRYYGLLGQRFSLLHTKWQMLFEECFRKQYALIHRLETNKARRGTAARKPRHRLIPFWECRVGQAQEAAPPSN